ncbi:protein BIG GRAIN 1-like B [Spinacia oleracea]|uniref:Protein BIG GRAIN 1-like B n=1 Tax=Spinacia oleracea TaxID=3562 RepID=A0A9R0JIU3_SPIOL|nr:protein BIG GRAIN 1-like B [Spinacia oleracea]
MSKIETTVHNNVTHKRRGKNPSFSSILLDAIYRSIDEDDDYPRTTPTSPTRSIVNQSTDCNSNEEAAKNRRNKMRSDSTLETVDLRRAIMIESWMERQQQQPQQPPQQPPQRKHFHLGDVIDQKIRIVRQKSVPSIPRVNSDDSSSSSLCFTNLSTPRSSSSDHSSSRIFTKTKSRALKIYGELKKSKQQNTSPVSPGRRIAAFLNSIFRNTSGSPVINSPEIKLNTPAKTAMTETTNSTCSTASSFSRSCLSNKTPSSSSSGKSSSTPGTKRSVRFYPVSVIVDEDGHKSLQKNSNRDFEKLISNTQFGGKTLDQQQKRRREKEIDALMMMIKTNCGNIQQRHVSSLNKHCGDDDDDEEMEEVDDEEEDDDDDNGSCASSDLFELENLSSLGVSRYYEELPVYGTTSLENLTA